VRNIRRYRTHPNLHAPITHTQSNTSQVCNIDRHGGPPDHLVGYMTLKHDKIHAIGGFGAARVENLQ
ncbi:MAG: hypothetical protein OXE84_14115, partial [Rhodobacteraceae bacterium]|nr:hypothetical protein [Paracoccaceae bacterium]MCY4326027.1 hypothetical protein [Paracoccaceae bacterium]